MSWTRFVFTLTTLTALLAPAPFDTFVLATQRNPPRGAQTPSAAARAAASPQTLPLKFAALKDYSTGTNSDDFVAVGDLRGNGYADLVLASCTSTPEIDVLLGNGNGTFNAPSSYGSGGSCPTSIAIGDVNGDGDTDLVVANLSNGSNLEGEVSVFLGNGTGTFGSPVNYDSGGSGAQSVAIADVNGDGYPDLIVANQAERGGGGVNGVVAVLLSDGHGSFRAPVSYSAGGILSDSVAVGDFNGDGHPDIVVANKCQTDENCNTATGVLGVLLNNGDGRFAAPVIYGAGGFMYALAVVTGDLNGDGYLDLVVSNWCQNINCTGGGGGGVSVLLGNGNGTFQPAVTYGSSPAKGGAVALGDVNGDGNPDVLVNGALVDGGYAINLLLGSGDGTLRAPVSYSTQFGNPVAVAIADLNGDGRPDLVSGDEEQTVGVFLNELKKGSTTATTSSSDPSIINQPVTFSATVTSVSPVPNGSPVIFSANSSEIGTGSTKNGVASVTTVFMKARTYDIDASYAGDPFHGKSQGFVTGEQKVTLYPSTTTLTSSPNPSTFAQAVTLTATVSSGASGGPTGKVAFLNGTTHLGSTTLSSGTATLITTKLPVGTLTLTANYEGDTQSAKSSGTTSQTVN
jgi:Bacterial Ig-like domain (group 3)/FG-GAP-like repeat